MIIIWSILKWWKYIPLDHIPLLLGFFPFIVGKVKPKIMFVICQAISVLSIIAICVYSFLKEYGLLKEETLEKFSWIPLVFIGTLIILRGVGIMPVLHILINEMYPTDIRTLSIGRAIWLLGVCPLDLFWFCGCHTTNFMGHINQSWFIIFFIFLLKNAISVSGSCL